MIRRRIDSQVFIIETEQILLSLASLSNIWFLFFVMNFVYLHISLAFLSNAFPWILIFHLLLVKECKKTSPSQRQYPVEIIITAAIVWLCIHDFSLETNRSKKWFFLSVFTLNFCISLFLQRKKLLLSLVAGSKSFVICICIFTELNHRINIICDASKWKLLLFLKYFTVIFFLIFSSIVFFPGTKYTIFEKHLLSV